MKRLGLGMRRFGWFVILFFFGLQAYGQRGFGLENSPMTNAVGPTLIGVDFSFDGSAPTELIFKFDGPAYGVYYNRSPMMISFIRGAQSIGPKDKLVLTDFSLAGWVPIQPFEVKKNARFDFFLPVGLQSDYRRIKRNQNNVEVDAFEYTVVAAGTGVGFSTAVLNGSLTSRAMGYYGIASRTFGFSTDTSSIVQIDIDWMSSRLTERFGLNVGYTYRWQTWYSDMGALTGHSFNFIGKQNGFRLGVSF